MPEYTGGYRQIGRGDFLREVTEESAKGVWVVLHLFKEDNAECAALHRAMTVLAERHVNTRFLKIIGSHCIEGFPDANLPTMIVYHDGKCQAQMVACGKTFGGVKADEESVEWVLAELGAVQTEQVEDPRLPGQAGFQIRRGNSPRRRHKLSPTARVKRRAGFVPGADDLDEDDANITVLVLYTGFGVFGDLVYLVYDLIREYENEVYCSWVQYCMLGYNK